MYKRQIFLKTIIHCCTSGRNFLTANIYGASTQNKPAEQESEAFPAPEASDLNLSPSTRRLRCTESPRQVFRETESAFREKKFALFKFTDTTVVRMSPAENCSLQDVMGWLQHRYEPPCNGFEGVQNFSSQYSGHACQVPSFVEFKIA